MGKRGGNMKRRIILWASVGLMVAGFWVLLSLTIPLSREPVLFALARLSCPIVPVSMAFHFGVKWYWVLVANIPAYALAGLMVEGLMHLKNPHHAL
jgi:hypothetical protein